MILVGLSLIILIDWVTLPEVWFGPAYLLLIGLASWCLGWREGFAVGLTCMGASLAVNGLHLYPYGPVAALSNLAARFGTVSLTIGLLETARRSYARQWELARTDPLTGALNRQAFFESLATTHSSGWSMLGYLDLDGFKKLNDELGHVVGDERLKAFADRVRKLIRDDDIFARIGGDEFLVYMNVTDEAAAKCVAVRLHRAINGFTEGNGSCLKCSIGVLILPAGQRSVDTELRLADQLMYEAKQRGADLAVATARVCADGVMLKRHSELSGLAAKDRSEHTPAERHLRSDPGRAALSTATVDRVAA